MIPRLGADPGAAFPPVSEALEDPDGLLAWGGGLEPRRLLRAYRRGIFPWYSQDQPILWWSPSRRCVLPTETVHVSRRLERTLHQRPWRLSSDTDFDAVVAACAAARDESWITPAMAEAYGALHRQGHAHSIEAWDEDRLVGGLYGVAVGKMFCGESMVSLERDASKVVLVTLCRALSAWGFRWLDCQVSNPHLERMGAIMVPRRAFLDHLDSVADEPDLVGPWTQRFELASARA